MTNDAPTIQQQTQQLNTIVAWFDSEDFTLEQAVDKFKEAEAIGVAIQKQLAELKNEINVVKQRFDQDERS